MYVGLTAHRLYVHPLTRMDIETSIQFRILKQVLAAEKQWQAGIAAILESINHSAHLSSSETSTARGDILTSKATSLPVTADAEVKSPVNVIASLQTLTARQSERDTVHDAADLRQLLRTAMQANNDAEMIRVLQVGRDEMPEAIKVLQRALEVEVEREPVAEGEATPAQAVLNTGNEATTSSRSSGSRGGSSGRASGRCEASRDTLDWEFIETGIDALQRLSGGGAEVALPSWTITRYEVECEEKIGMGFFSDMYRGTWRSSVVAIKVLAPTTPKQLFVHEVSVVYSAVGKRGACDLLVVSSWLTDIRRVGVWVSRCATPTYPGSRASQMRQVNAPPFSPRFLFYAAQARDRREEAL